MPRRGRQRHGEQRAADAVIDCVGYTAGHARMLLPFREGIGSLVFISSKAVYVDGHGRHANSDEPPEFDGPVTEEQPTTAPSDIDYNSRKGYGANKVAAENVLLDSGMAVSVLRPSRIHGTRAKRPREWVFVKRDSTASGTCCSPAATACPVGGGEGELCAGGGGA